MTFLEILYQNARDCISAHIHYKKISEETCPRIPLPLVAFGLSGLLPKTIEPYLCVLFKMFYSSEARKAGVSCVPVPNFVKVLVKKQLMRNYLGYKFIN